MQTCHVGKPVWLEGRLGFPLNSCISVSVYDKRWACRHVTVMPIHVLKPLEWKQTFPAQWSVFPENMTTKQFFIVGLFLNLNVSMVSKTTASFLWKRRLTVWKQAFICLCSQILKLCPVYLCTDAEKKWSVRKLKWETLKIKKPGDQNSEAPFMNFKLTASEVEHLFCSIFANVSEAGLRCAQQTNQ